MYVEGCGDNEIVLYLEDNNISKEVIDTIMEWCDTQREDYFQSGYEEGYGDGYDDGLERSYEEDYNE